MKKPQIKITVTDTTWDEFDKLGLVEVQRLLRMGRLILCDCDWCRAAAKYVRLQQAQQVLPLE